MFAQKTKEDMSLKKLKNIQILHFILTGMTDVQTESVWIWERSGVQLSSDLNSVIWNQAKIYIPSTLNIDLILWHTQLMVCAEKC